MADLQELADQAAEELLTAIRDQARNASDLNVAPARPGVFDGRFDRGQHKAGGRGRNRPGGD